MNTQKTVYNRLFSKEEKTELETHKVELAIIDDIKKYSNGYKKYYSELEGLQNRGERLKKELNETISAIYKWGELGDSMASDMARMLDNFEKKAKDLGINAKESKDYVEGQKSFKKYAEAERFANKMAKEFSKVR